MVDGNKYDPRPNALRHRQLHYQGRHVHIKGAGNKTLPDNVQPPLLHGATPVFCTDDHCTERL